MGEQTSWLSPQAQRAAPVQAGFMLLLALLDLARQASQAVAIGGALGLFATALYLARFEQPRSWLPTSVTGLRIGLTAVMAYAGTGWPGLWVACAIFGVFTLDGLDGLLARRMHSASELGARLDNESDAFLVLSICFLLYTRGTHGPWVLVGGLLRYVYVLVLHFVPSRGEVPRVRYGRYVFALSLGGYIAGFFALGPVQVLLPATGTLLLCWSFGRSFYWSYR